MESFYGDGTSAGFFEEVFCSEACVVAYKEKQLIEGLQQTLEDARAEMNEHTMQMPPHVNYDGSAPTPLRIADVTSVKVSVG